MSSCGVNLIKARWQMRWQPANRRVILTRARVFLTAVTLLYHWSDGLYSRICLSRQLKLLSTDRPIGQLEIWWLNNYPRDGATYDAVPPQTGNRYNTHTQPEQAGGRSLLFDYLSVFIMPSTLCCVPQCNKRGGHVFPSDPVLKKEWILAVKRSATDNRGRVTTGLWQPTKTSVVCKEHFRSTDYIGETVYGKFIGLLSKYTI